MYRDPEVFGDLLEELRTHAVAGSLLGADAQYQETVLAEAQRLLATDFLLEDER